MPLRPDRHRQRRAHWLAAGLALCLALPLAADELELPPSLEPAVAFWTRIYTEVDSRSGLIHDSRELDVVYEKLSFPEGTSRRSREREIKRTKQSLKKVLLELARGKRSGLSDEQARVLALWPDDVTDATLREASKRLRFQLGQADRFREGLVRAGAWRHHVEQTLATHRVPDELVALPHVESSFNPKAYSRVGAAGLWQFTRSTGRLFMRIDSVVDERLDPWTATDAAARLLAKNHEITDSWPLAITAYNHGAAGMRRAARKLGTKDIGEVVRRYRSRTFGFASRNFYASFLAASGIDRDPTRYFGPIDPHPPMEYTEFKLPFFTPADALAKAFGIDLGVLSEHNPALRPAVWNGSKRLPKDFKLRLPLGMIDAPADTLIAAVPQGERHTRQYRDRYHKVRRGETLSRIAHRYGVRVSELVAANNLRSRHRIRVGQVLALPGEARGRISVARADPPADGIYRVRRGDTLSIIAKRFGMSERELARANGIRNRHRIHVGQKLRVAGGESVIASAKASAPEPAAEAPAPPASPPPAPTPKPSEPGNAPEPQPEPAPEPALEPPPPAKAERGGAPTQDPSDYAVHSGHITVQAAETLGHYADWLELRASQLRRLNGMRFEQPVVIGRRIELDFSRVSKEEFERRRLEHHQSLQTEFFEAFVVTGTERHTLKRGESLWYLAKRKYRVPVWLLRQYNPSLDFAALPAGAAMIVPLVEPRRG